ncbi:YfcE family phosphodiesterase, partial [Pseudomonas aeruginosa]
MPQSRRPLRIGLIADTHGLLRPEALERLRGCDQLIHAGDIGKPEILAELERLVPLSVVRGNNDT